MDRPYIICHMLASLNAKVSGPYLGTAVGEVGGGHYEATNAQLDTQAWLCGRVTMEENFTQFRPPEIDPDAPIYPREDHVADPEATTFMVSVDPSGKVGWTSGTVNYLDRPQAHVVEVLTGRASDGYASYLRQHGVSYIFAGDDELDCVLAVQKLKSLFGVQRLALSGGGIVNGSFLNAGLVDELSIVIAPIVDDATNTNTIFERSPALPSQLPVEFSLDSVEQLDDGHLWLRYRSSGSREAE